MRYFGRKLTRIGFSSFIQSRVMGFVSNITTIRYRIQRRMACQIPHNRKLIILLASVQTSQNILVGELRNNFRSMTVI